MADKPQPPSKEDALISRIEALCARKTVTYRSLVQLDELLSKEHARSRNPFVKVIKRTIKESLPVRRLTAERRETLARTCALYRKPVRASRLRSLEGVRFVIAGTLAAPQGRAAFIEAVKDEGGVVQVTLGDKTDYVVLPDNIGRNDFSKWPPQAKAALEAMLEGTSSVKVIAERAVVRSIRMDNIRATSTRRTPSAAAKKKAKKNTPTATQIKAERKAKKKAEVELLKIPIEGRATEPVTPPSIFDPGVADVADETLDGFTPGQQEAFDLVASGANVYLTGLGGTGKSYIVDAIVEQARADDKNVIVCAPTGIAAVNVGGCTIHRALDIKPADTLKIRPRIELDPKSPLIECDLLVVDEISMCRMDLFDHLSGMLVKAAEERKKKRRPPTQLLVVGDFCQLPPVVTRADKKILDKRYKGDVGYAYAFLSKGWKRWKFKHVELTQAVRQRDVVFVSALNACRLGDTAGLHWICEHASDERSEDAVILCGKNADADFENTEQLARLDGYYRCYKAKSKGRVEWADMPTGRELRLKVGARVMSLANQSENTYMNGSLGYVTWLDEDTVTVRFDNGYVTKLGRHDWSINKPDLVNGTVTNKVIGTFSQIPLKLAWAMTIHKSQGQTFPAVSIYPDCWDPGQLYTALSRCTSIDGLHFARPCEDTALMASDDVIAFNLKNAKKSKHKAK